MKIRIIRLDGGSETIENVTRLLNFSDDEAPMDFDPLAGKDEGVDRTIYVNPEHVVCIIVEGRRDASELAQEMERDQEAG